MSLCLFSTSVYCYCYLTNINSPKYSSKPIVGVIKKQYLCRWIWEQVLRETEKHVFIFKSPKKRFNHQRCCSRSTKFKFIWLLFSLNRNIVPQKRRKKLRPLRKKIATLKGNKKGGPPPCCKAASLPEREGSEKWRVKSEELPSGGHTCYLKLETWN